MIKGRTYIRFIRNAAAALAAVLCGVAAAAQNSFTVDVPAVVSTGEIFRIVFSATYEDGRVSDFTPPEFGGMEVLAGPIPSSSTSFQSINGQSSTTRTQSYTYTVRIGKEGKYTVGQASVKIGKEICRTEPKTVEAVKGNVPDQSGDVQDRNRSAGRT